MAATYLDNILAFHRERASRDERSVVALIEQAQKCAPVRGFASQIRACSTLAVIAEIKRKSPSKGALNAELDPASMAKAYELGGASCLSVLTDEPHFAGSVSDLQAAREACSLPVLRKDFTVDARDVCDARLMGADCVLLIAAALTQSELNEFLVVSRAIGIDVLVEIHDEVELDRAMAAGATMVGVNQRDLVTFAVDHDRAVRMGALISADVVKIAESGVRGRVDAQSLRDAGYDAVLVGEHLVTASDPARALRDLLVE